MQKKHPKGTYGYIKAERLRRILITFILFLVPMIILISGIIYFKNKENLMTVIAIVGCLPACKSLVSTTMVFLFKPMEESLYKEIEPHQGQLNMLYEMVFTAYEKNSYVDAVAICGNQIVCYTSQEKTDQKYAKEHLEKVFRVEKIPVSVHFLKEKKAFLDRLDSMNANYNGLRAGDSEKPRTKEAADILEDKIHYVLCNVAL